MAPIGDAEAVAQNLANIFPAYLANIFPAYLANIFPAYLANIFPAYLADIFPALQAVVIRRPTTPGSPREVLWREVGLLLVQRHGRQGAKDGEQ